MPLEPIDGLAGTRKALQGLLDRVDDLRWDIRFVAEAPDGTVLYEKTEHYLIDGSWVALPCMIALEFDDADKIDHWRAYFDIATWTRQQPGDRGLTPCASASSASATSAARRRPQAVLADLAARRRRRGHDRLGRHQPLPPRRVAARAHPGRGPTPGHRRRPPRLASSRPADFDAFDVIVAMDGPTGATCCGWRPTTTARRKVRMLQRRRRRTSRCPTRGASRRPPTPRCSTSSTTACRQLLADLGAPR